MTYWNSLTLLQICFEKRFLLSLKKNKKNTYFYKYVFFNLSSEKHGESAFLPYFPSQSTLGFFFRPTSQSGNLWTTGTCISVTNCCTTLQLTFVPLKCMEVRVLNLSCPAVSLNRKRANMYIKKTFTLTQSNVMPKHQQLSVSCLNDML